eukprot:TRINITY_DN1915_c0_g2_i1.p1 TRINITY_DN1915_c0_g2~~TRINITY_DN1915_c0_g2_i1.p1  ORF type:complete len:117 (+),score=6.59 TRINITY_DN1915_c0_g2_i1:192-542(+)
MVQVPTSFIRSTSVSIGGLRALLSGGACLQVYSEAEEGDGEWLVLQALALVLVPIQRPVAGCHSVSCLSSTTLVADFTRKLQLHYLQMECTTDPPFRVDDTLKAWCKAPLARPLRF